jgi:hypothetical protein
MESQTGVQLKVDFLGLFREGVGFSQPQSTTNQSTSAIQVSHLRSTVVTADNQKAIGRAYWGPLGDLFVILVNPSFAASRRADATILYALKQIEQVLSSPSSVVPADVRRRLLELDPFLQTSGAASSGRPAAARRLQGSASSAGEVDTSHAVPPAFVANLAPRRSQAYRAPEDGEVGSRHDGHHPLAAGRRDHQVTPATGCSGGVSCVSWGGISASWGAGRSRAS